MLNTVLRELVARVFGRNAGVGPDRVREMRRRLHRTHAAWIPFEPLESRILLSADLIGIPNWVEQGPASITGNGNVTNIGQNNAVGGAVEAIAAVDANTLYIATVNGGVWRGTNVSYSTFDGVNNDGDGATDEADELPTWTPLTDRLESLSTSAIAVSPLSATTIFVGTGSFSSASRDGDQAIGILRSTDNGATWENFGRNLMAGERVRSVVPTSVISGGQVVLAATLDGGGLYRSTDAGANWALVSGTAGTTDGIDNDGDGATDEAGELNLPFGEVSHLVSDPGNANRFYLAIPGQVLTGGFNSAAPGIYRSDDAGASWRQVNTGIPAGTLNNARIELTVSAAAPNPVYAAFISPPGADALQAVFRTTDQGANWRQVQNQQAIHPGNQGEIHFSIVADPGSATRFYIAGDRAAASPFAANIFRVDVNDATPASDAWTSVVDGGANNTAGHADSRDMIFHSGHLVEASDGGMVRLRNPGTGGQRWESINGNLAAIEVKNIALNNRNNANAADDRIAVGNQDSGAADRVIGTGPAPFTTVVSADGEEVAADDLGDRMYFSTQNLNGFQSRVGGGAAAAVARAITGAAGHILSHIRDSNADGLNDGFDNIPFSPELATNAVAANRLLIGTTQRLYESTDSGATFTSLGGLAAGTADGVDNDIDGTVDEVGEQIPVNVPNLLGTVTTMAYGGRQAGADNANVAWIGTSTGDLFLRTAAAPAAFNATAFNAFANTDVPQDMVLDPENWARAFVVDPNSVFMTEDQGATWDDITGDLLSLIPIVQGQAAPGNLLNTIAFGVAGGSQVVLVGGAGGVFRNVLGSGDQWSEYGAGIPNTVVRDIEYDRRSDTLVAGTLGRGAWSIGDASDTLADTGVLQIFGDDDFFGQDDTIRLVIDVNNASLLDVFLNDDFFQFQLSAIEQINVFGLGGNDTLIVDSTNGLIDVVNGIRFDGDGGSDSLQLLQTGGPTRSTDTYSVGPSNGQGVSTIVGGGSAGTQVVFFENLEPVLDLVPATTLTVNATNGDNAINYKVGSVLTNGLVSVDAQETIEFTNKSNLVINALSGTDTVSVNNPNTPTGLTTLAVNGGDPGSGDVLTIVGAGVAASVNTASSTITGATGAVGAVSMSYSGIDSLAITGGVTGLTLTTTGANDALTVTPGATGAANSGTLASSGAVPSISFVNSGDVTANLGSGSDSVTVNATGSADAIAVSGAAVAITGRNTINYTSAESIAINAGAGADIVTVTPSATAAVFVDGGDPVGSLPGDLLNIIAGGAPVTFNAGPETDEGSFDVGANLPVSFDHIESFSITGSGPTTINGTNGPDAITVIARDASFNAAADGVRDFTVSVNTGPQILFLNVGALTVNALAGSDQVTLVAPAPNNAVWDVDVTINGGVPAADTDRLIVQTPGPAVEAVVYTPSAVDGGLLNLTSLSSPVTIAETELLIYDGQNDDDSLTVNGTGGDDTIVHSPGANDQAGTFAVNTLLPIAYQNLGATAVLMVGGAAGTDTLVVNGTAVNDSFGIGVAGAVSLNTRLTIGTTGIEALTLEGLAGDDSFTLMPALSASVYPTMNFNGGSQASAAGDRAFLVGTAGDDTFAVSGQTVQLGGRTMTGSGLESIRIDALGGTNNEIVYTGVVGVTENITVSSSGIAGGGQISVPGVTLLDFTGVQSIVVNGNVPGPTETDTLAFSGTNAVDIFNINLAAAGTTADPILRLSNSPLPAGTLLTLRSYTNFNTLRVNGLDGADTFNVRTSNAGVDRNVLIDGGAPTAKKKSTDNLNVFYTMPRPRIIHSTATQNPGSGLVDLAYDGNGRRFLVQYVDMEQVVISKS